MPSQVTLRIRKLCFAAFKNQLIVEYFRSSARLKNTRLQITQELYFAISKLAGGNVDLSTHVRVRTKLSLPSALVVCARCIARDMFEDMGRPIAENFGGIIPGRASCR